MPSFVESRNIAPPRLEKRPVTKVLHGETLRDDYAWLRATNWRDALEDPDELPKRIRAALEAENAYADAVLKPLEPLVETLKAELVGRIDDTDSDPPARDGDWLYYDRYRAGGQHPLACRKRPGGEEILMLDGDACAEDLDYFRLDETIHSPDHRFLAWSRDERGSELFKISWRDLATGADGADVVEDTDGTIVWTRDSSAFLYTRMDEDFRSSAIYLHRLGDNPDQDRLLFEESDPALFVELRAARSRRHAIVSLSDHDCSESWLIDLAAPLAPPRQILPRQENLIYDVEPSLTRLFMRTNADGAFDFKILSIGLDDLDGGIWREEIPHRPGKVIFNAAIFADHIAWLERENCRPRLVAKANEDEPFAFDFDGPLLHLRLEDNFDFFDPILRVTWSTPVDPDETYDIDLSSRARKLVKTKRIPSGHDPSRYETRLDWANAPDGTKVPLALVWRKDRAQPGPALLYGYGAYGVALPDRFDEDVFSLLDRGFVYATAHARGGGELGERWKQAGKLGKKPNTFADYLACARHLCALGLTAPGKIVAEGGSAGGMLMGAAANMAPELFAAILAEVPFVDVLNTICDDSLPLTPAEWREWGDPLRDRAAFELIRSYSPYDNVRAQTYPPILIEAGLTDPRVTYWEPAKWAQKLRDTMTGGGPIVLRTNMEAGHGGAAGRFDELDDVAWRYAFALEAAQ